jgi:hypothetical protein
MVKLTINRQRPFHFSQKIEADYGKFEIRRQHEIADKVLNFTVDNLMFFEAPTEECIKLSEFLKMISDEGLVPLDMYAARALYENKEAMWELYNLWNRFTVHYGRERQLGIIAFLGTVVARHDNDYDHFSTFKYHPMAMDNRVYFMPFEDDPFFKKDQDFFLVFKKEFISNL